MSKDFISLLCGTFVGMTIVAIPSYFIISNLGYYSLYAKNFDVSTFDNKVHCGLSENEVTNLLGDPLQKTTIKSDDEVVTNLWFYSKQKNASDNYILYCIKFQNGLVWDERKELVFD